MKLQLQYLLQHILQDMGVSDVVVDVSISEDAVHGEYTSNVAMKLAKSLKKSPMDIALQVQKTINSLLLTISHKKQGLNTAKEDQKISGEVSYNKVLQDSSGILLTIDRVEVVAPGFINIFVTEASLGSQITRVLKDGKRFGTSHICMPLQLEEMGEVTPAHIMVEFAHPNTHKAFHIGHLRNITTGESLIRLLEATGHKVTRANYQGDVGMHIAKCLWAMLHDAQCSPEAVRGNDIHVRVEFLGKAYAIGSAKYEKDDEVKKEIGKINTQIYAKDSAIYPLYQETRAWSLEYFAGIYARVNTHYDRLYFESETYTAGKQIVLEGVKKGIFEESDGAVIFSGEKYGLHTRVFITKEGNATYEGKDMGLAPMQHSEYHPDLIMHVLGPEQYSYTRVIFKALDLLFPDTANRQFHKRYGWVKLKHGKMSSRSGNVVLGEWLLDEAKRSIYEILDKSKSDYTKIEREEIAEKGAVAAVKYAFLRVGTDQEISFDIKESVSFDGDSGPYLLYTYARCKSVLRKVFVIPASMPEFKEKQKWIPGQARDDSMNSKERLLARFISYFPEIVEEAGRTLSPNILCTYLFKVAALFNTFYQAHTIVGEPQRIALTEAAAQTLHNGLYLLGIETVERM